MTEEKNETKISKNKTAKVKTKSGNEYSYTYVDIAQIHEYLESINAKYIQQIKRIDNDDYIMTKRCFDNKWEDEWLQGSKVVDATLFGTDNPAQKQGSALTYARRYSLLMAFGLATEDDDAQSLNVETKEENIDELVKKYKFTFGQYKGLTFEEIDDDDYLQYIVKITKDKKLKEIIDRYFFNKITTEKKEEVHDFSDMPIQKGQIQLLKSEFKDDMESLGKEVKALGKSRLSELNCKEAYEILEKKDKEREEVF